MTATTLQTAEGEVEIHRLDETGADLPRLPHTVKILLDIDEVLAASDLSALTTLAN